MPTALVVLTRDLRVRDNPALAAAAAGGPVVPLFVLDDAVLATRHACPNRLGYLAEALADLDRSLRGLGGRLVVRRGRWVDEVVDVARRAGAADIHLAADVSGFARDRLARLGAAAGAHGIQVRTHPGITVVPPGAVVPGGRRRTGDPAVAPPGGPDRRPADPQAGVPALEDRPPAGFAEYRVFTPYHRAWLAVPWRPIAPTPRAIAVPDVDPGSLPTVEELAPAGRSPAVIRGGEAAATERLRRWASRRLATYADRHDDLAGDRTSHVSADLHLGCLSPLEVATRLRSREGGAAFVRQLCWRDFFHQILAARPDAAHEDYRPSGHRWEDDTAELAAWKDGRTGYPIVDAGLRQLRREGFVHNRARMVVASFLVKDLGIDWRQGAAHFLDWLVDGDLAVNQLNWQWIAGTGTDRNAHRLFNPLRQAQRFDPEGAYVRRYVPELAGLAPRDTHDPPPAARAERGYPAPIVDHADAVAAHRARRG